jgi:hypothetical protein
MVFLNQLPFGGTRLSTSSWMRGENLPSTTISLDIEIEAYEAALAKSSEVRAARDVREQKNKLSPA